MFAGLQTTAKFIGIVVKDRPPKFGKENLNLELTKPTILYADCDDASRMYVKKWLQTNARGCQLSCSSSGQETLQLLKNRTYGLYLLDYCLDDMTAPELCQIIRTNDSQTPIIICSPFGREIDRVTSIEAGATDFIVKPEEFGRLATIIKSLPGFNSSLLFRRRLFHSMRRSAAII